MSLYILYELVGSLSKNSNPNQFFLVASLMYRMCAYISSLDATLLYLDRPKLILIRTAIPANLSPSQKNMFLQLTQPFICPMTLPFSSLTSSYSTPSMSGSYSQNFRFSRSASSCLQTWSSAVEAWLKISVIVFCFLAKR